MILKILDFLNILDYSKRISLTNVSLMLLVGKLLFTPSPDFAVVGSVIIAFANYAHKRSTSDQSGQDSQEPSNPA
jgi:hypothetical protein